jgi:predicted restriction endonuclease
MIKADSLEDRRKSSNAAKARLVEHFKTRLASKDPEVLAKAAERKAISEAREQRLAVRAAEKKAKQDAIEAVRREEEAARQAEIAAAQAAAEAEVQARQQADRDRASRVIRDEAERKSIRDARYAARKARKQG